MEKINSENNKCDKAFFDEIYGLSYQFGLYPCYNIFKETEMGKTHEFNEEIEKKHEFIYKNILQ